MISFVILTMGTALLYAQPTVSERKKETSITEALQAARTLFAQGNYEGARKYYLEALPSSPRSFDILKNLAFCYFSIGARGLAEAAHYYEQAYEINPRSQEVADKLANCYMAQKRYKEAVVILTKRAQSPEAPAEVWKRIAAACEADQRLSEAEEAFKVYLERKPSDLEARSELGRLYGRRKSYRKALEQFRLILSSNPNFPPALIGMARVLSSQRQPEDSLALYDRALRLQPKNEEALSGKASVLLWMGRAEEARPLLSTLHKAHPGDAEVARELAAADAAIEQKVIVKARHTRDAASLETYYRQRLSENPKDLMALKGLAKYNAHPQRCKEGSEYARRALESSPQDPDLELLLARSLNSCQQYDGAIAGYQRFLQFKPQAESALSELGDVLLRAHRFSEASEVFENLLRLSPQNAAANTGSARALAATGDYKEALARYDKALKTSPDSYDAFQGKAYVLYYTQQYAEARQIFKCLAEKQPRDQQNDEALANIARAEEAARWAALRPPPDAPPQSFLSYFRKRLASYPDDEAALKGVAYYQAQLKDLPAAIQGYERVIETHPDDGDAKIELARLLSANGQYDGSIKLYRGALNTAPDDVNLLEGLARAYLWSNRDQEALETYLRLLAKDPSNTSYELQVARLELSRSDFPAAREVLGTLLSVEPQNHEARLDLAQLDLKQGSFENALTHFERLLKHDPNDPDALLGEARVSYYLGNMRAAQVSATKLVGERPDNFEGEFLLATIEHARGHRRAALAALGQAARLSPGNREVFQMKKRMAEQSRVTLHTSASYAREIGPTSQCLDPGACGNLDLREDLYVFSYGTTIGLSLIPQTDSYFSFTSLPSDSPPGRDTEGNPATTGLTGAVAPSEFLYRQRTRLSRRFTLRAGGGVVRFGPGGLTRIPEVLKPLTSAASTPLAIAGITFAPNKRVSFDLDATRLAIANTPLAAKLGVVEERMSTGLNVSFSPRTELQLNYFFARYYTKQFKKLEPSALSESSIQNRASHTPFHGVSIIFNRNLIRSNHFSFDAGYTGVAFGHLGLTRQDAFLGFFNPVIYNRNMVSLRPYGKLSGPLSYEISYGLGIQQANLGKPIKRALIVGPNITLKASPRVSFTLGYLYYNTPQSLGTLTGNAVRFSTDWRF